MGIKCKVTGDDLVCPECGESMKARLEAGLGICEHVILTNYQRGKFEDADGNVVCTEVPLTFSPIRTQTKENE